MGDLQIKMVDLHRQYLEIKQEIDKEIEKVIEDTSFINGPSVNEFVENLASWNGTKYVIPCANGTDGLQIALMALDLKQADEVLVPAFTYIATVEVICLLGLKPVFVDVDPRTFNLDVNCLEKRISNKTKAIVPVHLYGQCADMRVINEISDKYGIYVIEDLAQAIGAEIDGVKTGNFGSIGVTSFFPSKNLGCFGDGGAIFTNDDRLAERLYCIANHGQKEKYYHEIVGVNSRLDTLQAAILKVKLTKLDSYIAGRQGVAQVYDLELGDITEIEIPFRYKESTHVFHQYTIRVKNGQREGLKKYLGDLGIPSMIYYPLSIPEQNAYKEYRDIEFGVSEVLSNEVLSLPMHPHLTSEEIRYICQSIKKYFNE
ncbi:MAG: DegT/DnrJ/EryC1/StrS family aminotransferase [Cyclobacteriaceae bacterium]